MLDPRGLTALKTYHSCSYVGTMFWLTKLLCTTLDMTQTLQPNYRSHHLQTNHMSLKIIIKNELHHKKKMGFGSNEGSNYHKLLLFALCIV